jgi:superfamily II DNA or RNA helicase
MPLPVGAGDKLAQMGFRTVREALRAALAGRLASRKKGGARLEDQVLSAGCTLLGYPPLTRKKIKDFRPASPCDTVGQALADFCGAYPSPSEQQGKLSIRELLLPAIMHNTLLACGANNLREILKLNIDSLQKQDGSAANLGLFLVHLFDYLFILNDPAAPASKKSDASSPLRTDLSAGTAAHANWLDQGLLIAGRKLLAAGRLRHLLLYRHVAGAIFEDQGQVVTAYLSLKAAPETTSTPTWILATAGCEACFPAARYQSGCCRHVAALTLHLQTDQAAPGQAGLPRPLLFPDTPWVLISRLLYELYGADHKLEAVPVGLQQGWRLTVPGNDVAPLVEWQLDEMTMATTAALFAGQIVFPATKFPPSANGSELISLWRQLLELGHNPAEVELNAFNQRAPAQEFDESIWQWLSIIMHQLHPDIRLSLVGPDNDGLFSLLAEIDPAGRIFRMTLPRAKTPDLVDAIAGMGDNSILQPAARAATKISMAADGTVTTEALLHLADGRVLERRELAGQRYGRYYFLVDAGFFPVIEQSPELALDQDPESGGSFQAEQVPDLLRDYHQAFNAPENQIDPDLQALDFQELPDRLQVDSYTSDSDWCYLAGHYGLGNRRISLIELLDRRRTQRKFVVGGAKWLKLTDTPLDWFHDLDKSRLWRDAVTGATGVRLTKREMLMLSVLVPEVRIQADTNGGDLLHQLLDTGSWATSEPLPNLSPHLRDYQRHGVAWLNQLYRNRLAGILADDMGLGKTHQTLALFDQIRSEHPDRKFLVICPATVVPHWVQKIEEFFPSLSYYVYHGSRRDLDKAGDCAVCLTTYGIIRRDSKVLSDLEFEIVVFDEIQQLKNRKTDVHRAAARLKAQVVIGLTGTPLENSVHDLKAIFDICLPGYFGSDHDFKTRYADPITNSADQAAQRALSRLINPFILRRTREQVLPELPDVIEDFRTCELSDDQVTIYRELINGHRQALLVGDDPGGDKAEPQYMELLATINYLKQVCNHPCLIKKCTDVARYRSGKWDLFVELLEECLDGGMKVVVFSHYTSMLDLIEKYLRDRGISHCGLRGEMPMAQRHRMINKFNTDESCLVFTASLLTGGIGVDLTAARAVIHYDRWWNAAREDQATARVHRMGQKHVVQVFKLITVGTLEEKINRLIARKKNLANQMIRKDDAAIIKRLSRDELLDLLTSPET